MAILIIVLPKLSVKLKDILSFFLSNTDFLGFGRHCITLISLPAILLPLSLRANDTASVS